MTTLFTVLTSTLTLSPFINPLTIAASGGVVAAGSTSTGAGADAIDGGSLSNWWLANYGVVSSQLGYGVALRSYSYVNNSGAITGSGAVLLAGGGSLVNYSGGTITATGSSPAPLATISGVYVRGGVWFYNQVLNYGVIKANGLGYGVGLGNGGTVDNRGSVSGGEDGVWAGNVAASILNRGAIVATADDGVGLLAGGSVANFAGGAITGVAGPAAAAVFITGGRGNLVNSGLLNGGLYGALIAAGGSVVNNQGGKITGVAANGSGVSMSHGGSISNGGIIQATGAGGSGVDFEGGGSLVNGVGGVISGASYGVFSTNGSGVSNAQATIRNSGTIVGALSYGVQMNAGGRLQNNVGGAISGRAAGVDVENIAALVSNAGLVTALGANAAAVQTSAGGTIVNAAGGTMTAAGFAVFATGVAATVFNAGAMSGADGIELAAGGAVTNLLNASLSGQGAGVYALNASVNVANAGSISAAVGAGLDFEAGGGVINSAGGAISGATDGIFLIGGAGSLANAAGASISGGAVGVFMSGGAQTVVNGGAISTAGATAVDLEGATDSLTNSAGGTIGGATYGVFLGGVATVENAGSISGGTYAVDFAVASSANLLKVDVGASFSGWVAGNGGGIELSAGGPGSIGGVGAGGPIFGFQTMTVDSGATWTATGANAISKLVDMGALTIAGSFDVTAALDAASVGLLNLAANASLELAAALGAATTIDFQGASQLVVDDFAKFGTNVGAFNYAGSTLKDFGAGDSVDLKTFNYAGAGSTYSFNAANGLLQIGNGSQSASLDFDVATLGSGAFQLSADSGGGTIVTRA